MSRPIKKTKAGAVDRRSETSARNVSKARDVIARYVSAGKRCLSDEEDLVIEESSDASECETPQAKPEKKTRPQAARSPEPAVTVQPWEAEISSLRAELALFREQAPQTPQVPQAPTPTPQARTPLQEHQNTVTAIRRSILLKF